MFALFIIGEQRGRNSRLSRRFPQFVSNGLYVNDTKVIEHHQSIVIDMRRFLSVHAGKI